MKCLSTLLLALSFTPVLGQVVHPVGAATTRINWYPLAASTDSLSLDLDNDRVNDVTFSVSYSAPLPYGPTRDIFSVAVKAKDVQLAVDSSEYDSVHRFQAGEVIKWGLRWDIKSGYLDEYLNGNGGIGGRGFFRYGRPGYVVVRKQLANNQWRYWWFHAASEKDGLRQMQLDFYGSSLGTALAASPRAAVASVLAYPNPSPDGWLLPAGSSGAYRVLDCTGRVVAQGQLLSSQPHIEGQQLAPGLYWLERTENNRLTRQPLSKY